MRATTTYENPCPRRYSSPEKLPVDSNKVEGRLVEGGTIVLAMASAKRADKLSAGDPACSSLATTRTPLRWSDGAIDYGETNHARIIHQRRNAHKRLSVPCQSRQYATLPTKTLPSYQRKF